jgi:DNA adenine methylase
VTSRALPRPFVKWAGGKTQLLDDLLRHIPAQFGSYHEPFVGGGALFFALRRDGRIGQASISDLGAELIDAYLAVRDRVEELIATLSTYPYHKGFYYQLRAQDPWAMSLPQRAARMIYLNKTGYNGLYRVNRKGQFNVPFGRYKRPKVCDAANLRAGSEALMGVEMSCASFERVLDRAQPGDLVYFDPPYVPLSRTASFTSYQAACFGEAEQERLRDVCVALTDRGVRVMLSNSATEAVRRLYHQPAFSIREVQAKRSINSNAARRGKLAEWVITNYDEDGDACGSTG